MTPSSGACRFVLSLASTLAVLAALHGCGGSGGGGDTAPPPPPPAPSNQAPVGAFSAAASTDALAPLALDASASSDADGDALIYHWNFGDGTVGGGQKVAHVYTAAGSYAVRLTVDDGRGGVHTAQRTVSVNAPPAPVAMVQALAIVRANSGALLAGVSVAAVGASGAPALTDAQGRANVAVGTGVAQLLKFSKAGFADQFRDAALPGAADSGYLEVTMLPREAALTLPDAAAGGTLSGKDGASVTFPPNALVDGAGNAVSGAVQVSMTPVDIANNIQSFPGRFAAVRTSGQQGLLMSYGTVEYALSANGAPVQLAPGRRASIDIPVYAALHRDGTPMQVGDTSPLWSLDERTGAWTEEGSGTVVAAATPSGFALRAQVQHFSWWNHDVFISPPARPKPKCMVDTNADGILEDLTGTGHCWHAGTGPEQASNGASAKASIGAAQGPQTGQARALAEPRTQRIPGYVAWASTPAAGGVELPIPADMDITFRSYAKGGTLFGMKTMNLGPDVSQEVVIVLAPMQDNAGTRAITLPYVDTFRMDVLGETDRFTFAGEAGATYRVAVARANGSTLGGGVRVLGPTGTQLNGGVLGASGFVGNATPSGAGTLTVEVQADSATPGAYRIEVTRLTTGSGCASPTPLGLPATAANFSVPGNNGQRCFTLELAADDVLEIKNVQNLNSEGFITLISPAGLQVASDSYGTGVFDGMLLKVAVAQAGTWRLEILNTRSTTGTINGLSTTRLAVASTLGLLESVSHAAAATGDNARYHLIKPGVPRDKLVLTLDGHGINHGVRVHPPGMDFGDTAEQARVLPTVPGVWLLAEAFRRSASTAWNYTLGTRDASTAALDTDITVIAPGAGIAAVYAIPGGSSEQQLSLGRSSDSTAQPALELYAPITGARVSGTTEGALYTLSQGGSYTLVVRNSAVSSGAMKLRINAAAPPEAVNLATALERTVNLQLGEVCRYTFNATQGQVLALGLSAPMALNAQATLTGGNIYEGFAGFTGGPAPRSVQTTPRYVQVAAAVELRLYASGTTAISATGAVTVKLQSPPPVPTALGALAFDGALVPGVLQSYRYDVASAGAHLLCARHIGGASLEAKVWGPSAPFSNYAGDVTAIAQSAVTESVGQLRAGPNTLSLMTASIAPVQAHARLAALPAVGTLTPGAAASSGALAACQRAAYRFDGVAGQSYTLRVTAAFAGSLRVRKQPPNGDPWVRLDPPFNTGNLASTPLPLVANVERVLTFTVPSTAGFGSGVYVVEVDDDNEAAGAFSVQLSTP